MIVQCSKAKYKEPSLDVVPSSVAATSEARKFSERVCPVTVFSRSVDRTTGLTVDLKLYLRSSIFSLDTYEDTYIQWRKILFH